MQLLKRIFIGLILVIIVAAGGMYVGLSLIDQEQIKTFAKQQIEKITGREVTFAGPIEPALDITPSMKFQYVTLANADWAGKEPFLEAESITVSLALMPLISGEVEIESLGIQGATLRLNNQKNRNNWDFLPQNETTAKQDSTDVQESPSDFRINQLQITDSLIIYQDQAGKKPITHELTLKDVTASHLSAQKIEQLDASINIEGADVSANGRIEDDIFMGELTAGINNAAVTLKGNVALDNFTFDAQLNATIPSIRDVAALFDAQLDEDRSATIQAKVGGKSAIIHLTQMNATYGDIPLNGNMTINVSKRVPHISATLRSDLIDMQGNNSPPSGKNTLEANKDIPAPESMASTQDKSAPDQKESYVATPKETSGNADASAGLFPDTPLPVDALAALDAELNWNIKVLRLPNHTLENLAISASLANQILTIKQSSAQLHDGTVKVDGTFNAKTTLPALQLHINTDKVQLGPLLRNLEGVDPLSGAPMKADLVVDSTGTTVKQLAASATGTFTAYIDKAAYTDSIDIEEVRKFVGALRQDDTQQNIAFECAVMDLQIDKGIATTNAVALKTQNAIVIGDGEINLGQETIRLGFTTRSEILGFADVVPPLIISGPLTNPEFTLDAANSLVSIGKFVLGATSGIGLVAVIGEQVTNKLGITAENDPCLQSIANSDEKAANAAKDPKKTYKVIKNNLEEAGKEKKEKVDKIIDKAEEDIRNIRNGLKSIR